MFISNIQGTVWNLSMMRMSYKLRKLEKIGKSLKILKMSNLIVFKTTHNKLAILGNITVQHFFTSL